eukprot:TRINITY_DN3518_c1_g2_i3.p3 TRINITY_DN3518_c1_g2~~TRINITY_DN3518_c1_g2_i3.p3  ORF type:complete len:214 (-),score=-6.73 TRINITY_DN3518_c1_g2_i3:448-1089(-)
MPLVLGVDSQPQIHPQLYYQKISLELLFSIDYNFGNALNIIGKKQYTQFCTIIVCTNILLFTLNFFIIGVISFFQFCQLSLYQRNNLLVKLNRLFQSTITKNKFSKITTSFLTQLKKETILQQPFRLEKIYIKNYIYFQFFNLIIPISSNFTSINYLPKNFFQSKRKILLLLLLLQSILRYLLDCSPPTITNAIIIDPQQIEYFLDKRLQTKI